MAAFPQYGWTADDFLSAYEAMRARVFEEAAYANPLVEALVDWLGTQQPEYPGFDGSPDSLLATLNRHAENSARFSHLARSKEWPKSASVLVRRLRAARSGLAQLGIELRISRDNNNRSRVALMLDRSRQTWEPAEPTDETPF